MCVCVCGGGGGGGGGGGANLRGGQHTLWPPQISTQIFLQFLCETGKNHKCTKLKGKNYKCNINLI